MYKRDFTSAEFKSRRARLGRMMDKAGIDLAVIVHPSNINWLIGARHKSYQQFQCLFVPRDSSDDMVMLTRLAEVWELQEESLCSDVRGWGGRGPANPIDSFAAIVNEKRWKGRRIGLDVPRYYIGVQEHADIRAFLGRAIKADITRAVESLRWVKSAAELKYVIRASAIADEGMAAFVKAAKPGRTEHQMAAAIYNAMLSKGGDVPASPINIGFGPRSAYGHPLPSERRLARGDFGQVEYGGVFRRYCVTIGRQFVIGKPTARQKEIYQAARDACDATIDAIRPGVRGAVPHEAAKRVIVRAGMEEGRWHLTGYSIAAGFPPVWGDNFELDGEAADIIQEGMILSVEPPVFLAKDRLGARIIDNVLVTKTGCRVLSRATRDLVAL
jgi:Xaa-Pro dipeptidase